MLTVCSLMVPLPLLSGRLAKGDAIQFNALAVAMRDARAVRPSWHTPIMVLCVVDAEFVCGCAPSSVGVAMDMAPLCPNITIGQCQCSEAHG